MQEKLRALPSVDELINRVPTEAPRELVADIARGVLDGARAQIRAGMEIGTALEAEVFQEIEKLRNPSLRRVINATGVVLHTNLGRAPLAEFSPIRGYSNLEYDLEQGRRGKRDTHLAGLFETLIGSPAIAVNNNAAAVYLALHELAAGGEVIVSRGELIEIGDSFRIPDIMSRSGAVLREVGTTNRTTIDDYRAALNERTRLILVVHPSNFHIEGFTAKPELKELAALANKHNLPLYQDLGSGCVVDLSAFGIREPLVQDSIEAGVDVVSFSTDKLLGGPQAGVLAGKPEILSRLRRNPMFRALRLDKLMIQALETTVRLLILGEHEQIPALSMIALSAEAVRRRAEEFAIRIARSEVVEGQSVIGGGSTPAQSIPTWLLSIGSEDVNGLERRLRKGEPPVVARIEKDRLLLDLRTVDPGDDQELLMAVQCALS